MSHRMQSGYCFAVAPTRRPWRTIPNDSWDTEVYTPDGTERYLGTRIIDGSVMAVFVTKEGYKAQLLHMTRNPLTEANGFYLLLGAGVFLAGGVAYLAFRPKAEAAQSRAATVVAALRETSKRCGRNPDADAAEFWLAVNEQGLNAATEAQYQAVLAWLKAVPCDGVNRIDDLFGWMFKALPPGGGAGGTNPGDPTPRGGRPGGGTAIAPGPAPAPVTTPPSGGGTQFVPGPGGGTLHP